MFRRITTLSLVAVTVGLFAIASEASAQFRGGFGGGGIGIGGRGGYIGVGPGGIGVGVGGGYGRGYGGGYYPGSYRSYGYGYGSPGYYGGYRSYGNYGYSYPSGGSYYSQGPAVYSSPQIVTPAPSSGVTVARPPVPSPASAADDIKLKLPASAGGSVNYELNGTSYVMNPGYSQRFAADRSWTITFDDGTGNWDSRTLSAGNYEFTRTSDGRWDLRKL